MAVDENYSSHQRNCIILMKAVSVLSMISSYFITRDVLIRFHSGERIKLWVISSQRSSPRIDSQSLRPVDS